MKIGIDISQLAYAQTGVANYLRKLVEHLIMLDRQNEYILFYSSLRTPFILPEDVFKFHLQPNVTLKQFKLPPSLLDLLWNKLHIMPIEHLIGNVDVFITSDWTEPPVKKAKKVTILYDVIVYKYPEETAKKIIETQKRKLAWVKKETAIALCISEATKNDAEEILGIPRSKLAVIYPGL